MKRCAYAVSRTSFGGFKHKSDLSKDSQSKKLSKFNSNYILYLLKKIFLEKNSLKHNTIRWIWKFGGREL